MKLIQDFEKFLSEEVNLNRSRITKLETHVTSIQNFLDKDNWGPPILRYSAQGSWAHQTIIKPPGSRGFDADLLVFVEPLLDTAKDYVLELRRVFHDSEIYKEKASLENRCVTIDYAEDFSIDVVPCVVSRVGGTSTYEVCNRVADQFEPTDPEAYTAWLAERDNWAGTNKLQEVTRLLKYLRDIKQTFSCKSILLTTLLGQSVTYEYQFYQPTYFPDVPTALKTLIGLLDQYLQDRSELNEVYNPVLLVESFNRHWDEDKYKNFRDVVHRYREWVDDAYDEPDEAASRSKWQRVFGDEFGRGAEKAIAKVEETYLPLAVIAGGVQDAVQAVQVIGREILAHVPQSVPWLKPALWRTAANTTVVHIRATAHHDRSGTRCIGPIQSGELLEKGIELRFEAVTATGMPYASKEHIVQWQVVNTDREAWYEDGLRGGFYRSHTRAVRWENTKYRGVHWVQALVIRKRDRACVGRSDRFFVVIE